MKTTLFKMKYPKGVEEVLEEMRSRIAEIVAVTLVGNRLTVRFYLRGELVDVHMIIESVTTVQNAICERVHGDAEWCTYCD